RRPRPRPSSIVWRARIGSSNSQTYKHRYRSYRFLMPNLSSAVIGGSGACFLLGATINGLLGWRQAALQARVRLQQLVSAHGAALVALATPDGQMCYASPSFHTILGCDPALALGKLAFQYVHPDDRSALTSHFAR